MNIRYLKARLLTLLLLAAASCADTAATANDNANQLAAGRAAKTQNPVPVAVNPVVDFNWKTREEILNMRRKEVNRYPELLLHPYSPYGPIWNAVEDRRPWWGTAGSGVWGSGPRSIEGPAEESRFIMNPFLLVGANPNTLNIWDPARIKKTDVNKADFPYFWYPESIVFHPCKAFATATYNITRYQSDIVSTGALLDSRTFPDRFSLVAYNARDFGYHYIWLNTNRSINVLNDHRALAPVLIRQMLHCGGTCQYDGGCNNMSPFMKEIDRCRFTKLPARAVVHLWRDEPDNMQKPDFIFVLDFK